MWRVQEDQGRGGERAKQLWPVSFRADPGGTRLHGCMRAGNDGLSGHCERSHRDYLTDRAATKHCSCPTRGRSNDPIDDRHGRASTQVAAQVPGEDWHARFPDPTLGDAILDHQNQNAYRLELRGESMRNARLLLLTGID